MVWLQQLLQLPNKMRKTTEKDLGKYGRKCDRDLVVVPRAWLCGEQGDLVLVVPATPTGRSAQRRAGSEGDCVSLSGKPDLHKFKKAGQV